LATIHDVARYAGVSVGTVSAVLNGSGRVSPKLQQKVDEAIQALDYRPSHYARALKRQRTHSLAYLVPDVTNPGFASILRATTRAARQRDYTVFVFDTGGDPDAARESVERVIELRVDGVILSLTWDLAHPELVDALRRRDIEAVGISGSRPVDSIDCFLWDEVNAGYTLARYLLRLGHRVLAFLHPADSESAGRRLQGIRDAYQEAGIPTSSIHTYPVGGYTTKDAYEGTLQAISSAVPFSALIAFNDAFVTGATAALADQGLWIPEHISVATFGNSHTTFSRPQITSMTYDYESVGARASRRLLDRIEKEYDGEPRCEYVPMDLVVRPSCRAVSPALIRPEEHTRMK
jgi:DNA-binding LacI/PurR family transcriptional regulator